MKVRRVVLGAVVVTAFAVAGFAAQGCLSNGDLLPTDCDKSIPLDCCLCPLPDDCPPYLPEPRRKLPAWCDQYLNDGGTDGGEVADAGMTLRCANGACVSLAPGAWKHVAFFMDWAREAPACPDDAPILEFEGSPAPPDRVCPACSCDEPEGVCSLPTKWRINSATCNPGGDVGTNFDAPANWEGTCTQDHAIAQGTLCGGMPCVRSLTISPPVIDEKRCVSRTEGAVDLPVLKLWNGGPDVPIGRACSSDKPLPNCTGQECVATNTDFKTCVMHDGDMACPEAWNGDRHVLYTHVEDARECTACACDSPTGGTCKIKWRTFAGPACTVDNFSGEASASMMPAPCTDLDPGLALAGKTAEVISYTKGSCTPTGGDFVGKLIVENPVTICCRDMTM